MGKNIYKVICLIWLRISHVAKRFHQWPSNALRQSWWPEGQFSNQHSHFVNNKSISKPICEWYFWLSVFQTEPGPRQVMHRIPPGVAMRHLCLRGCSESWLSHWNSPELYRNCTGGEPKLNSCHREYFQSDRNSWTPVNSCQLNSCNFEFR